MDLSRLRDAALTQGEDEEAVTVDTRALIDKVLARYSGEWTTLRELIQNAADARATTVTVKWETIPSTSVPLPATSNRSEILKHVVSNHTLRRLLVQNDGQPFTKTDWGRLKRIAEGNPDETKIGAFGVGFYSVFADCEEPFVSSGNEAMAFYWKGNALFTRKLNLSEGQGSKHTTFMLDYRNATTPVPNLLSVSQFMATSLTFVALEKMEFWIDDYNILTLYKKTSPPLDIPIPRDLETRTREGLMNVASVCRTSTQIDASYMKAIHWKLPKLQTGSKSSDTYGTGESDTATLKSWFSRLTASSSAQAAARERAAKEEKAARDAQAEDVTVIKTSTIFLRATSATITAKVSSSFSAELERATKKPPPKTTKLEILTSSYDDTRATELSKPDSSSFQQDPDLFSSVLPNKKPGGRIFIGFPTMQTTGAGMHISAPSVIPTVEREAIDLNARWVRTWNMELLRAAGIIVRLAFANEMSELGDKIKCEAKNGKVVIADAARFVPEALHILKTFTFTDATPSRNVGQVIEEAFWVSYRKAAIEVLSSRGVMFTSHVRIDNDELSKFVDGIPVIPKGLKDNTFIQKLHDFGLISHIKVDDIKQELEQKALGKTQLVNFITWAAKKSLTGELDVPSRASLLGVAVATVGDGNSGEIIALESVKNFLLPNRIPVSMPIPPTTISFEFTSQCKTPELQALGWEPLDVLPWLRYLIDFAKSSQETQNVLQNAKFAASVLVVVSKNWDNTSQNHKANIVALLRSATVMPTKMGMKRPEESYFPSVKLFDDLPTLDASCTGLKEKFTIALGVRKTVELDTIFARLLNNNSTGGASWSHVELIRYLASVRNDIPAADMRKLIDSKICPAEAGPVGMASTKATTQLYKVSELFEPKDSHRLLGLRCLQWPGPPGSYRPSSAEGRFLSTLGLRPFPTVPELVEMMCSNDSKKRFNATQYFIGNHHINGYGSFDLSHTDKAICPIEGSDTNLVRPSQCYTSVNCALLGFKVLKSALHPHASKFGVARDPPISSCVGVLLARPPNDAQRAKQLFEYFAARLADIQGKLVEQLRGAAFVPVADRSKHMRYIAPKNCYLGSSPTYDQIFDFVDFGETANAFLFKCGAKSEPTKLEVAEMACSEPVRLLGIMDSPDKYLNLLRHLAEDIYTLKRDKDLWRRMKGSAFLLGFKETPKPQKLVDLDDDYDDADEAPVVRDYQLSAAKDIVVPDDYISYRLFKDSLVCAPEEDVLETFYLALGAQQLSSLVHEDLRVGQFYERQDSADRKRKHFLERTKLFLHEFSKYNRDAIKHDSKWLEKNLAVRVVLSIQLRRSLRGHRQTTTEKRYAASEQTREGGWVLYIAHGQKDDMYQVGQAICHMILKRPSQQAFLFFEPFLALDLLQLRDRGYNVDRILRARAAEARIAEEERRKAAEEKQRRRRERELELVQAANAASASSHTVTTAARENMQSPTPEKLPPMPGSFGPDSPEHLNKYDDSPDKGKGLFNHLSRTLGFKSTEDAQERLSNFLGGKARDSRHDNDGWQGDDGVNLGPSSGGGQSRKDDDGKVTDPSVIQHNLAKAVQSTRPHGGEDLFSPPQASKVKEQSTYCDNTTAKDLVYRADSMNGMRVYLSRTALTGSLGGDPTNFLRNNTSAINTFSDVLADIARSVYGLERITALHLFYDDSGGTIAFNSSGSLFCNLRFYLQLHHHCQNSKALGVDAGTDDQYKAKVKADCAVYWFVVLAHELAHNLVGPHNSDHSYYTESFIQQYWAKLMNMISKQYFQAPGSIGSEGSKSSVPPSLPPSTVSASLLSRREERVEGVPPLTSTRQASSSSTTISGNRNTQYSEPPPPYHAGPGGSWI